MTEPAKPAAAEPPPIPSWEDRLPRAQVSLNRFCENWLFAFLVAMSIRHVALEAFRIPTASMEPMLYGDPAFTRSDFVLVDKLVSRFRTPQRWDVTVFQFPAPEIEVGGRDQSAYNADDKRIDNPITQPLMYRNFVKRLLTLPGERFYIAHGDLFVAPKGTSDFAIARKPAAIQEAVWEEIYRHGAQTAPEWYVPWKAGAGGAVENRQENGLRFAPGAGEEGAILFDQPLRNLYVKPGKVRVQPRLSGKQAQIVDAAMTAPLFTADGRTGNIWRLDEWMVSRMTSADLDSAGHGTELNQNMRERIGDVRLVTTITSIEGAPALRLREGTRHRVELRLTPTGWTFVTALGDQPEAVVASGQSSVAGRMVSLANIDDEVVLTIDGIEEYRGAVPTCDPDVDTTQISWVGRGSVTVSAVRLQRDLHYCANGFLAPEKSLQAGERDIGAKARYQEYMKVLNSGSASEREAAAKYLRHEKDVRSQMLGIPVDQLSEKQCWQPVGFSPETAITTPDNAYLLLGDNSPLSWDGRNWGFVPAANLRGRVVLRARARFINGFPIPFGDWAIVK